MELQILHAIQGIHQEWLTEILRFFTTIGESGLVWIVIAIVLTCIPKTRKCGLTMIIAMAITYLVGNLFLKNVIARPRPCAVDTRVTLKVPFGVFLPLETYFQWFCRSVYHFQLLS